MTSPEETGQQARLSVPSCGEQAPRVIHQGYLLDILVHREGSAEDPHPFCGYSVVAEWNGGICAGFQSRDDPGEFLLSQPLIRYADALRISLAIGKFIKIPRLWVGGEGSTLDGLAIVANNDWDLSASWVSDLALDFGISSGDFAAMVKDMAAMTLPIEMKEAFINGLSPYQQSVYLYQLAGEVLFGGGAQDFDNAFEMICDTVSGIVWRLALEPMED